MLEESFHVCMLLGSFREKAITKWFKGNIETLDTLLLCAYGRRLTAQHTNLNQMRGERQELSQQWLVERKKRKKPHH